MQIWGATKMLQITFIFIIAIATCWSHLCADASSTILSSLERYSSHSKYSLTRSHHDWGLLSSNHFHRRFKRVPLDDLILSLRGGSDSDDESDSDVESDSEDDTTESEYDSDTEDEESDTEDEYDSDEEYDDEYDVDTDVDDEEDESDAAVQEYDEVLAPPTFASLGVTLGVTLLSNRIDMNDARIVKFARIFFIAYVIVTQLFLLFVRLKAKQINDRTPVVINNPLSSIVGSQLANNEGNSMVKNIASSFLSSESTVLEYDLKQAKTMSTSLLFPMVMLWFLHFKMNQVQPIFFQTASGILNLLYSPLFQVYVLGRNLERPFKMNKPNPLAERAEQLKNEKLEAEKEDDEENDEEDAEDEESDDEESDDEESDEESEDEDEDATDSDSDSDSDESDSDDE